MKKKLNESNNRIHTLEKQCLQYEEHQKNLAIETERYKAVIFEKELKIREQERLESELLKRKAPCEERCNTLHSAFQSLIAEHDQLNTTLKEQRTELAIERRLSAEEQSAANQIALTKRTLESKKEYLRITRERLEIKKQAILEKLRTSRTDENLLSDEISIKTAQITEAKSLEKVLREEQEEAWRHIETKNESLLLLRSSRDKILNRILLADSVLDNFEGMPEGNGLFGIAVIVPIV